MAAKFIQLGEAAHDAERQALRFLVEGLPDSFTVYGNAWLVERTGVVYELDAVVVAPHAIFIVEIKSYRGRIEGTDNDWWLPEKIRSPLKLKGMARGMLSKFQPCLPAMAESRLLAERLVDQPGTRRFLKAVRINVIRRPRDRAA